MRLRTAALLPLLLVGLLFALMPTAAAQETEPAAAPARDPLELAQRLLGYEGETPIPPPTPLYSVGDVERFVVPQRGEALPRELNAVLVGRAPGVYLWVEEGVSLNGDTPRSEAEVSATMQQLAAGLSQTFGGLRLRSTLGDTDIQLEQGEQPLPEDLLPLPDVDNNGQIFVLYTRDLPDERTAFYHPIDSIAPALLTDGWSNGHETILVNTTFFVGTALDEPLYSFSILRAYLELLFEYNNPEQADWLQGALIDVLLRQLQEAEPPLADIAAYLDAPDVPLLQTGQFYNRQTIDGAQQLFLSYMAQRFGGGPITALFRASGSGMASIDAALASAEVVDPVSSVPVTARDLFNDFMLASLLNQVGEPIGDGRYLHRGLPEGLGARVTPLQGLADVTIANRTVEQFGAYYLLLNNDTQSAATISLRFEGAPETPRLPMTADRLADDPFYWSGTAQDANARMTRAVDLRAAVAATLTFDAWYSMPEGINYAYLSVSTDDGATWQVVPTTDTTTMNRFGVSYGAGFTGVSNPDGPQPFPNLGIVLGENAITIDQVAPGGPAEQAGVQAGDTIIGYDGQQWQQVPNIVAALLDYAPGDTITLMIQRGEGETAEQLDIPVVLGAHPTRVLPPDALWRRQQADLTPFAGEEILLRFETVTLPGYETLGFAIDNLEIAEVNFGDGGEQPDAWTMEGFGSTENRVAQTYTLQVFSSPTQASSGSVRPLIAPGDLTLSGSWELGLAPGQQAVVAVSGLNDQTTLPATFSLVVDVVDETT